MASSGQDKKKLALVYGNLPTVEEIDQFQAMTADYDVSVISSESICGYLTQTSCFQNLHCMALPDHEENTTYLPGLEKVLGQFDIVVVKGRMGLYAYQAVKAKWRHRYRLVVWVDNATPFPGEDINQMRTVRDETTNAADAFIAQTRATKQALITEGVEKKRIYSFAPTVALRGEGGAQDRAEALKTSGLSDTDFVISYFGQIEWEESLFDLAHAVKSLESGPKSTFERIKIAICGIGSFSTELRSRLVSLGLDRNVVYVAPSRDAFRTILAASDCIYHAPKAARDRIDADPYRLVTAMAHRVPVLAPRTPLVEEFIGKHRLDFCQDSPVSLAKALKKALEAKTLTHNIVEKNEATFHKLFAPETAASSMHEAFSKIASKAPTVDQNSLDHQVMEAEALVQSKQYLAAIDLIESVFQLEGIPLYHQANLYRLIGDCFTKLGDGDSGKNSYLQAIELDPYSAKAYIGLGTVGLTKESYDIAVLHFQKAVNLAPEDEMANLGLGLAFKGMEEAEEANRWVCKALEINPENTAALFTQVQIAYERGVFDDAENALRSYLEIHPHDQNMAYTLAAIKHKTGKVAEAKSLVSNILEVDPADEKARSLLSELQREGQGTAGTSNG